MRHIKIFLIFNLLISFGVQAQEWIVLDTNITHTNRSLNSAFFVDDTTGYVVGAWGAGANGIILKTTNAGASWTYKIVSKELQDVYFPSRDTGYAVGRSRVILKTTDGGATWNYQNGLVSTLFTAKSVVFINNDTGFISLINGPGYAFLKTYDGGINWINDVSDTIQGNDMFRINNTIYGVYGKLSRSIDKGATWTNYALTPTTNTAESVFFIDDNTGFATTTNNNIGAPCTSYGSLIKTTDAGHTWTETNYDCGYVYSAVFPSSTTGYMLGTNTWGNERKFWKTTDGGNSWAESAYPLGYLYDSLSMNGNTIVCTDANTCYILTNYGTIVKTTTGGGAVGVQEQLAIPTIEFDLYPNPVTSTITIQFSEAIKETTSIEIKNMLGQTMKSLQLQAGSRQQEIDVSGLANGFYFVQYQNKGMLISKKFVKQ